MQKYKIIASIAKIENNKNNQRLEVIGSFVKYENSIDFDKIMATSSFLSKNTNFFEGNEFIVLNLNYWESYDMEVKIDPEIPVVKIINLNIFAFVQAIKENNSLNLPNVLNTKTELKNSVVYRDESELFSLKNFLLRNNMKNKNVILIFDSITLSNIYILLKFLGVTIYGGSSQRRHLLSTVHKSLVMFLQLLDNMSILPNKIYASYTDVEMIKGKNVNKVGRLIDNVHKSQDSEERSINKSKLNEYTNRLSEEYDFLVKFNGLLEFYITITYYYLILIRNKDELKVLSEKVESHRPKIKSLNSEIEKIEEDIQLLVQSMYQLDNDYFNEQGEFKYDPYIKIDLNNVKSSLGENTKNNKINTLNQKREYSTFVRNNSCHNIRSNIFNNNKRYLYTNNSIISNKIMELLYSDQNKEVVQRNIEKYLMNEQNNYILQRVSSTPINYSLLSNEISSKIIGSVKDLNKLHTNSLGIDIFGKDSKFNKVLRSLEFDYITQVIFGRLITILSYNDIANKYTYVTEVAFNLGRDLVNKYNYVLYEPYKSSISFSLFCEENSDQIISLDEVTNIVQLGNVGWLKELKLITSRVEVIDHKKYNSNLENRNLGDLASNAHDQLSKVGDLNSNVIRNISSMKGHNIYDKLFSFFNIQRGDTNNSNDLKDIIDLSDNVNKEYNERMSTNSDSIKIVEVFQDGKVIIDTAKIYELYLLIKDEILEQIEHINLDGINLYLYGLSNLLAYRSIIWVYDRSQKIDLNKFSTDKAKLKALRALDLSRQRFMTGNALVILIGLNCIIAAKKFVNSKNINVNVNVNSPSTNKPQSALIFLFTYFKKLNFWIKLIILFIIIPIIIISTYPYLSYFYMNYLIFIKNYLLYFKYIVSLYVILNILYDIIRLYFINKFSRINEVPVLNKYIPSFLSNEIISLYEISKYNVNDKSIIIGIFLKNIFAFIVLLLIVLTTFLI